MGTIALTATATRPIPQAGRPTATVRCRSLQIRADIRHVRAVRLAGARQRSNRDTPSYNGQRHSFAAVREAIAGHQVTSAATTS
jgi:hypothetical protein